MPECASGWQPNAGLVGTSKLLDVVELVASAASILTRKWNRAINFGQVVGSIPVLDLCKLNPTDPGDLTVSNFTADLTAAFLPGFQAPNDTIGQWLFQKCLYAAFTTCCYCPDTGAPPPPPIAVTEPPGVPDLPTAPDKQDQATRIEHNQSSATDSIQQLYNGLQRINAFNQDMWSRGTQIYQGNRGLLQASAVGEGNIQLPLPPDDARKLFSTDVLNVIAEVTALPSNVGIRGTLNPRYYGIGSIYWDCNPGSPWTQPVTFARESIHYRIQTFEVPRTVIPYRLGWRLMPGAVANFWVIQNFTDNLKWTSGAPSGPQWQFFGGELPPDNWSDPPIYPNPPARRLYPAALPP
jgi:hypothetical protein